MAKQLLSELYDHLDAATHRALQYITSLAEHQSLALYLVGGAVRDLLLGLVRIDIDLVVEGDAIALADGLALRLGIRATSHPRFGTATVRGEDHRLDIAQARSEHYARPGALPVVSRAGLAEDLLRRDFTINAMAVPLTGLNAGSLIDLHGGKTDLEAGLLRVLHDCSFQDDPTRILRAGRYAGRLGFRLEEGTEQLLRRDLPCLDTVSGARLRHEFERIALEDAPGAILALAGDLGVLQAIDANLCVSVRQIIAMTELPAGASSGRREAVFFAVLLESQSMDQTEALISRLALTGRQAAAVRGLAELGEREVRLGKHGLAASDVVSLLSGTALEAVEALAILTGDVAVRERLRRYLDVWRFVRPRLNGSDIEALGVPHGPEVGAVLDALRVARLDGVVATREEEVTRVRELLAQGKVSWARHG